jgi:hypothetical protein
MYDFEPEKSLRLVHGTFNLAIMIFTNASMTFRDVETKNYPIWRMILVRIQGAMKRAYQDM